MKDDKIERWKAEFLKLPKHRQESIMNIIRLMLDRDMFQECALCGQDIHKQSKRDQMNALEMEHGIWVCRGCQETIYIKWRESP